MHIIWTIAKKELRAYFNSPLAYIFINVFLVIMSWLFFQSYFQEGQADMRAFFGLIPWVFLFFIPAITMRLWAEEKKLGTVEFLLTLPVKDHEAVLGKFLASLLLLAIVLLLSWSLPILVAYTGPVDWGVIVASYVGALFLGAAYLALGIWLSAFTDNQIIAFIVTVVACFFFFMISQTFVLQSIPAVFTPFFRFLGLSSHFDSIMRGVFDSRDLIYYLSFIGFFLFLNVRSIMGRRFQ
ncbi:MAG: ABC transporter permease subunit [bacterium]|nr:ABC transporter permease subunit [bacterium]